MKPNYKNCPSCKHYKTERLDEGRKIPQGNWFYGGRELVRTCEKGNYRDMLDWWLLNKHKTDKSELDTVPCFEETESGKMLNDMLSKTNEILELLKNKSTNS